MSDRRRIMGSVSVSSNGPWTAPARLDILFCYNPAWFRPYGNIKVVISNDYLSSTSSDFTYKVVHLFTANTGYDLIQDLTEDYTYSDYSRFSVTLSVEDLNTYGVQESSGYSNIYVSILFDPATYSDGDTEIGEMVRVGYPITTCETDVGNLWVYDDLMPPAVDGWLCALTDSEYGSDCSGGVMEIYI